jgi:hypothetical protein
VGNSPINGRTGLNQSKTAIFEGILAHFGHFGAFLLDFWPFLRFFDPPFPKNVLQAVGP